MLFGLEQLREKQKGVNNNNRQEQQLIFGQKWDNMMPVCGLSVIEQKGWPHRNIIRYFIELYRTFLGVNNLKIIPQETII